jgi:hypothetical protein|tara:strand:+ start:704 stop:1186 length:483 start_codon:yes stop_codon:yes gene_type:complete
VELEIINHWVSYETPLAQIKENKMKLNTIGFITLLLIVGCKETGIHIVDNPDGTSVKVSYWAGNDEDNQPNIVKIGNRGSYMKVTHNVTFMTKYNTPLKFELENGQEVIFECNKSAQKRDYSGELETDWEGNPSMECLEHKVTKSTISAIKVGAIASIGI